MVSCIKKHETDIYNTQTALQYIWNENNTENLITQVSLQDIIDAIL